MYSVTDAMGGAVVGDMSGRLVQSQLVQLQEAFPALDPLVFDFSRYIQDFVDVTDHALSERLKKYKDLPVGSSLALLMIGGQKCYTMAIGSCRIYLLRDGKLHPMTKDHVLPNDRDARPLLYFGNRQGSKYLKASNLNYMKMREGDVFLLVTDGVTKALTDQDIAHIFTKPAPFNEQVRSVFLTARRYDANDNQTVLGVKLEGSRLFTTSETGHYNDGQRYHRDAVPKAERPKAVLGETGDTQVLRDEEMPSMQSLLSMREERPSGMVRREATWRQHLPLFIGLGVLGLLLLLIYLLIRYGSAA